MQKSSIKKYILSLFFSAQSGKSFGYLRILTYLIFLALATQHPFHFYSYAEKLLWKSPLHLDFIITTLPDTEVLWWLNKAWLFFLLLSAIGFLGRFAMIMSFVLGYYLLAIPVGFLTSHFQFYLPTVVLGIFAFSRAHDFISIDSLIKYKTTKRPDIKSTEYSWPLRLVLFNVVFMYFGAAIGKFRYSGLSWATDGTFQHHLITAHTNFKFILFEESIVFFEWLINKTWLVSLIGISVLFMELLSPLAFFYKKTLPYFVLIWILFHISIALFMGITVSYWFLPALVIILSSAFSQRSAFMKPDSD